MSTLLVVVAALVAPIVLFVVAAHLAPGATLRAFRGAVRRIAGFARRQVRVLDHDVVYYESGQGPTIVLVHGFGADKDTWVAYAARLKPHARVVIIDVPGFGDSTYLDTAHYGYAAQVERLKAFVDALGLAPLHLAGNSMGGAIVGHYAAAHPGDVRTLLLMDNAAVDMPKRSTFLDHIDRGENPLIMRSLADVPTLVRFCFHRAPPLPRFVRKLIAAQGVHRSDKNARIFDQIFAESASLEPLLPKIQAPTLIMWGEEDRILDVSIVDVLERHLPKYRTVRYANCGHIPYVEMTGRSAADHLRLVREGA
jgi:pimeloyl-ACP methyl ester carboxylesterase